MPEIPDPVGAIESAKAFLKAAGHHNPVFESASLYWRVTASVGLLRIQSIEMLVDPEDGSVRSYGPLRPLFPQREVREWKKTDLDKLDELIGKWNMLVDTKYSNDPGLHVKTLSEERGEKE